MALLIKFLKNIIPEELPIYYRKVRNHLTVILIGFICLVTTFLIVLFSFELIHNFGQYSALNAERTKIEKQIKTWQSITDKFKGYKDGYLQLAVLEFRIGEFDKAKLYLNQALYLDPGYKEAQEFQKILKDY